MIKLIGNVMQIVCGILIASFVMVILFVCVMTPEKTKDGNYTDIYKYWTDDVYLCRNFNCDKGNTTNLVK